MNIELKKYALITPEGTRDLLFEECNARRCVERALNTLFKSRGFDRVMTPTIEFYDVFNRDSAGRQPEELYSLIDSQGRMLVLRADSTLPIARVAATRLRDAQYPLRLYYNQSVFCRNPRYAGFNDESSQGGIELIGAKGEKADLEVLLLAVDALTACGAQDFKLELGHAGFLAAVLEQLSCSPEQKAELYVLIEAKNYSALDELLSALGDSQQTQAIRRLPRLFGGIAILEQAQALCQSDKACEALDYLRAICAFFRQAGLESKLTLDLGLAHRSNYYTGIVFRGYMQGSGQTVLSGGRYDLLIQEFGKPLAAIGFGVEVGALAGAMLERGDQVSPPPSVVLVFAGKGRELEALLRVKELSAAGIRSEYSLSDTRKEAENYAKAKGIPKVEFV